MGLIAGVVIGTQYTLILFGCAGWVGLLIGIVPVAIALGIGVTMWKYPLRWQDAAVRKGLTPKWGWVGVGVLLLVGGLALTIFGGFGAVFGVVFIFGLLGSPWLYLVVYSLALARVLRSQPLSLDPKESVAMPWTWWAIGGAGYAAAWGGSVLLAIIEYAKLPTQNPSCYVATAAAHGHPRFVRSQSMQLADGQIMRVNAQLRTLKAGEIALRQTAPRLHRAVRRVYDRVGPTLATRMRCAWVADAAFVLLWPAGWLCGMVLRRALPDRGACIDELYR